MLRKLPIRIKSPEPALESGECGGGDEIPLERVRLRQMGPVDGQLMTSHINRICLKRADVSRFDGRDMKYPRHIHICYAGHRGHYRV